MWRRVDVLLCSIIVLGLLAACAMVDKVDPRFDTVNRSTAKARDESILLNIIRAAHSAPLNFVAFSKISGTTNVSATVGLPNFLIGPFMPLTVPTGVPNLVGQVTQSTISPPSPQRSFLFSEKVASSSSAAINNFDISLLESKDFYQGLLRPVDLPVFNYFVRQGYSRELMFWLFAEAVRVTAQGRTVEFLNDPEEERSCEPRTGRCFRHMVDLAMATGLTVETKVEDKKSAAATSTKSSKTGNAGNTGKSKAGGTGNGGKAGTDAAPDDDGTGKGTATGGAKAKGDGAARAGNSTTNMNITVNVEGGGSGDGKGEKSKTRTIARLCFDPVLAARARRDYDPQMFSLLAAPESAYHPRCKVDPWDVNADNDVLTFTSRGPFGMVKYEIITRSTFGIYQYLGRILATNRENLAMRGTLDRREDPRILAVERHSYEGCFIDLTYQGEYYCVPARGAESTKRTFSLLAQLVALNTNTVDLAITPTVRVQNQ